MALSTGNWQERSLLHEAVESGDVDKVREMLEGGECDVNCINRHGQSLLHVAAAKGHFGMVRLLISDFEADVNTHTDGGKTFNVYNNYGDACTNSGETPLHWAASDGHLDIVRVLILEFKADVNACTSNNLTPFDSAIKNNREEVALALMNEFHCNTKGGTPYIHTACKRGWVHLVRALLQDHGTCVDTPADNGKTPFEITIENNREAVAVTLMNEFHCDTKGGKPYIHTACERGWVSLVRALLLKHDICVDTPDGNGNTPFDIAVKNNREAVALALANEFQCNTLTKGGTPYIYTACERGWANLVRSMVQKHGTGIVTARDKEGNTPLHVAAMSGSKDVVLSLVNEFGCDINVKGHLGRSLLHAVCAFENGLPVMKFVGQYISPWVVDDNGDTPLHICARLRYAYRIKDLLELNPPVTIRNNLGQTPKDLEEAHKEKPGYTGDISAYMKENRVKIYSQYEVIQRHARKKYSIAEPITIEYLL